MTVELDLGHLQLQSAVSGLQLHARSTAKFASSEEDDIARVQTLLTAHKLDPDSIPIPWISKGDNMTFVLHLRLNDELKATVGADFVDQLSSQLRNAKLWQQLFFSKPSAQVSRNESDVHRIELRPKHAGETAERKRRPHKLGVDVPHHDVRPPWGVVQAKLERVDLRMEVEQRPRKRPRQRSSNDFGHRNANIAEATTTNNVSEAVDHIGVDFDVVHMLDDLPIDDELNCDIPHKLQERSQCNNIDDEMLLDAFEMGEGCAPTPWTTVPQAVPLDWQFSLLATDECNGTDHDIYELVTMAISTAVSGPRKRHKKGFAVSIQDLQSLASIAPSIWSPGYMKAVADRSVFLPTIAHTLAAESDTCSGTTSNGTDMGLLVSAATDAQEDDDIADSHSPENLATVLHASLWKKLQHRVYDANAAKRLDAFWSPMEPHPADVTFPDDMLEWNEQSNDCLDLGDGDIFSDFNFDDDDDSLRYHDNLDENDEWFRSDDDSDEDNMLGSTLFDTKSTELCCDGTKEEPSNIWFTGVWAGVGETITEENIHEANCMLSHHQLELSTVSSGGYTSLSADNDLDSICSSVEMLPLPDSSDIERLRADGWVRSDMAEMLVL